MRNVNLVLRVSCLLLLRHAVWQIRNLIVSSATGRDNKRGLTCEVARAACTLRTDRWVDSPFAVLRVLNGDLLRRWLAHDSIEVKLLGI